MKKERFNIKERDGRAKEIEVMIKQKKEMRNKKYRPQSSWLLIRSKKNQRKITIANFISLK